jgi:hypothetical protein
MKFTTFLIGLSLTASVFADSVTINSAGSSAGLSGSLNGTSEEILSVISDAHAIGLMTPKGANVFKKTGRNGVGGFEKYENKNISASSRSGITRSYTVSISAKAGQISLANAKTLIIKGDAAEILRRAISAITIYDSPRPQPVGVGMSVTKSGKISCSRVVYPGAVTSCTIKL